MLTRQEFITKIRTKYPTYSNIDDNTLYDSVLKKYPEYELQIEQPQQDTLAWGISSLEKWLEQPKTNWFLGYEKKAIENVKKNHNSHQFYHQIHLHYYYYNFLTHPNVLKLIFYNLKNLYKDFKNEFF